MANKDSRNNFITKNAPHSGLFLQSPQWKKFQESLGRKVFKIEGVGQFIKMPLPFGKSYLYSPGKQIKKLSKKLKEIAKKENAIFIRSGLYPSTTVVLDLSPYGRSPEGGKKSEDELLKEMGQKTRYNIRLSEKKDLEIKKDSFNSFWRLNEQTSARQSIKSFSRKYYEKLLGIEDFAYVLTVCSNEKPLASGVFIDFAGTTTYLFGASSNEYKNLMAPYFLHWYIIKEAIKKGQKNYDFWGINPEDTSNPTYTKKWEGITRFKKGFGGKIITSPNTFELPVQKGWYRIYKLVKLFKY